MPAHKFEKAEGQKIGDLVAESVTQVEQKGETVIAVMPFGAEIVVITRAAARIEHRRQR